MRPAQNNQIQQDQSNNQQESVRSSEIRYPSLYYPTSQSFRNTGLSSPPHHLSLQSSNSSHQTNSYSMISSIPQQSSEFRPTRTSQFFSFFKPDAHEKDQIDCSMLLKDLSKDQNEESQKPLSRNADQQIQTKNQKEQMSRTQVFMSAFRLQKQQEKNQINTYGTSVVTDIQERKQNIKNIQEALTPLKQQEKNLEISDKKQEKQIEEYHEVSQQIQICQKNQLIRQDIPKVQSLVKYETKRPSQQQQKNEREINNKDQKVQCIKTSEPKIVDFSYSESSKNLSVFQLKEEKDQIQNKSEQKLEKNQQIQNKQYQQKQENQISSVNNSVQFEESDDQSQNVNKEQEQVFKNQEISSIQMPSRDGGEQWQSESQQYVDSVVLQQTENEILVGKQQQEAKNGEEQKRQEPQAVVLAIPVNGNLTEDRKSLIIGLYTYNKFTPQLITNLEKTIVQYYPSNYFHVGPRRQILNAIHQLVTSVKQLSTYTVDKINERFTKLLKSLLLTDKIDQALFNLAYQKPIKQLGNELRLFWEEGDIQEICEIASNYDGSNYFHVGKRRYIFNEVTDVISQVKETRKEIRQRLPAINAQNQPDDAEEQQEQQQDDNSVQQQDEQDDDQHVELPPANNRAGNQPFNQSFYSTASTQVSFQVVPTYTLDDLRSYECGLYLKQKMSSQLVTALRSTISMYNSSTYFHVGPRGQILGFMSSIARFVTKIQAQVVFPQLAHNSNADKLIQIGSKLRKYMTPNTITSINSICSSYSGSNYFHVGSRSSIFSDTRKIIEIYSQLN